MVSYYELVHVHVHVWCMLLTTGSPVSYYPILVVLLRTGNLSQGRSYADIIPTSTTRTMY